LIWNNTWNEPVYWTWDKQARTDLTSFTVPIGELKPNCQYKFRIEPRSNAQDSEHEHPDPSEVEARMIGFVSVSNVRRF
jgi:hypothetical protein